MRRMSAPIRFAELILGEDRIDAQHGEVVQALNDLRAAIDLEWAPAETQRVLDVFAVTVARHFASEADMMHASRYPQAPAHLVEHSRLLDQLDEVQSELAAGKIRSCGALALFAEVWTTQHIRGADRLFAEYLKDARGGAGGDAGLGESRDERRPLVL